MKLFVSLLVMLNFYSCMEIEEIPQEDLEQSLETRNASCLPNSVTNIDCSLEVPNSVSASFTKVCSSDGKSYAANKCIVSQCAQGFKLVNNSCVAQKCFPRQVTQVDCSSDILNSQTAIRNLTCDNSGNNYFNGNCELVNCKSGFYKDGSLCRPSICQANSQQQISCKNAFANAKDAYFVRSCDNLGKSFRDGICTLRSCMPGFVKMNGSCRPQICSANQNITEPCFIGNALKASRTMSCDSTGTSKVYGSCVVQTCSSGFVKRGNSCVATSCVPNSKQNIQCSGEIVGSQSAVKVQSCNSSGTGSTYSSCTVQSCRPGFYKSGNTCVKNICTPSTNLTENCQNLISNSLNASLIKTCNSKGTGYTSGSCNLLSCVNGYMKQGNKCVKAQCTPNAQTIVSCSSEILNSSDALKIVKCDALGASEDVVGDCQLVSCKEGYVKQGSSCTKTQCNANSQRVGDCTALISNALNASQTFTCNSSGSSESAGSCRATRCIDGYSVVDGLCQLNVASGPVTDPGREPGGDPVNTATAVSAPPYVPKIYLSGIKQGSSITNASSTDFRPLFIPEGYGSLVIDIRGSYDITQNSSYDHKADNIEIYSDKSCTNLLLNIDLSNTQGSASQGKMNFSKRVFIPEQSAGAQFLFVKAKNSKGSSSCSSQGKVKLSNVGSQPSKFSYPRGTGVIYNVRSLSQQSDNSRLNTLLNIDSSKFSLSHLPSSNFDLGEINGEKTVVLKKKIDKSTFAPLPWDTMSRDGSVVMRSVEQLNNAQNHIACQVLERVGSKLEFKQLITHENSITQYVTKQQGHDTPFVTSRCYDVSDDGSMIIVQHTFDTCLADDIEEGKVPCDIGNTKIEIYMKDNSDRWVSTHSIHPKLMGSGDQNGTWDKKKAFMGTRLVPTFFNDNNTILLTAEYMYSKQLTAQNMNKIGAAYIFKKSGSSFSQTLEVIGNRDLSQDGYIEHTSLSANGSYLLAVDSKTESQIDLSLYSTNGSLVSNIAISNESIEKFDRLVNVIVSNDGQRIAVALSTDKHDSGKDRIIIMKKNGSNWIREGAVRDNNSSSGRVWNIKFSPSSDKLIANFDYPLTATSVTCGRGLCKVGKFIKHLAVFEKIAAGSKQK